MPPSRSSSSLSVYLPLPLILLLFFLPRPQVCGAAEDADCSASFRAGPDGFVLDVEDAVKEGAAVFKTTHVPTTEACESACCDDPRCDLALVEPRGTGAAEQDQWTCILLSCVRRNQFVCRFVNQAGYRSYVRESVFQKHLQGPQRPGQPIANAGRDVIVQPNRIVILNGTESLALGDAHITDYHWSLQSGDPKVRVERTEKPDQVQLSNLQVGSYVFRLTITDSNSQSADATVTVLVLSPEQSTLYCLAPIKDGPCRAAFSRWRYNASTGTCEKFVFGGCNANNNNYLKEEECLSACRGVTAASERGAPPAPEACGLTCRPDQLTCSDGCCVHRGLECDGVTQCRDGSDEDHCDNLNHTFSRLLSIDISQRKADCAEPPRTGPCRASHTRWFYDPLERKCRRFTFGGCDGNDNNFEEEDRCSKTCDGVTEHHVFSRGMFEYFEKEDTSDDSGSIALAVILSVAILALLAILTYCFLKRRRERSHQPVATGPAHVVLSEQDTLVYNSTTKPI